MLSWLPLICAFLMIVITLTRWFKFYDRFKLIELAAFVLFYLGISALSYLNSHDTLIALAFLVSLALAFVPGLRIISPVIPVLVSFDQYSLILSVLLLMMIFKAKEAALFTVPIFSYVLAGMLTTGVFQIADFNPALLYLIVNVIMFSAVAVILWILEWLFNFAGKSAGLSPRLPK